MSEFRMWLLWDRIRLIVDSIAAEVVVAEVVLHALAVVLIDPLLLQVADKDLETLADILRLEDSLFDIIFACEEESGGVREGFGFLNGFHVVDHRVDLGVIAFGVNGPDEPKDVSAEPSSWGVGDWGGPERADIQNRVKVSAPAVDGHPGDSLQYEVGCAI